MVLRRCVFLLDHLLTIAFSIGPMKTKYKIGPVEAIIHFRQYLIQGLWGEKNDPFYQLPLMNEEVKIKNNGRF